MSTLHTTATSHFNTDHNHHHQHHLSHSSSSSSSDNDITLSGEIGVQRDSSASDCLSEMDLESGVFEDKVHSGADNITQKDCRICHLGLESYSQENGVATELGCSCKGDLASAHKKCAETWFKIKGNTICEICGTTALNVAGKQANEVHTATIVVSTAPSAPVILVETRTFWHSRRIMNFLLACMVLGFVISWLFHFKVLT